MNKVALVVLDGLGIRKDNFYNAVNNANMPYFNKILKDYSSSLIKTHGEFVGLPSGQFGNSEVGHLNLGAGRIVKQNSTRITDSINLGEFYKNETLLKMINVLKESGKNLHLFGLCSNGGVHSDISHLYAILSLCKQQNFENVYIHFISDGRDTNTNSGKTFLKQLNSKIKKIGVGKVVSLTGRFYAMDREKNFDRTKKFFEILSSYKSENQFSNLENAFDYYYENNVTDEYILPTVLKDFNYKVNKGDSVLCFNFRSDRVRQIFKVLIENNYKNLYSFIEYDKDFTDFVNVVFEEESKENCLSEVLSKNEKTQLRISETTKYAHVTYFFNLLKEEPFKNEERIIIDSEKVDNFSKTPKMKAGEIADKVIEKTKEKLYDFILVNFSNADMLGHTGDYKATIQSLEFMDKCLEKLCKDLKQKGYIIIVTSDHGNADTMKNQDGSVCTTHTTSDAPFIIIDDNMFKLRKNGKLSNVSPTILDLMNINKPKEFTENSLILK